MPCIATENIGKFNRLNAEIAATKSELANWYELSKNKNVSVFYEKHDSQFKNKNPNWMDHENECSSCKTKGTWSYTGLTVDALELTAIPIQKCKDKIEKLEKEIQDLEE